VKLENSIKKAKVHSQFREKSLPLHLEKREKCPISEHVGSQPCEFTYWIATELKFWNAKVKSMTLDRYGFANHPQRFFFQQGGYAKNGNYWVQGSTRVV